MSEDMELRNFAPETQRNYIHHVKGLAQFYQTSPEHRSIGCVTYKWRSVGIGRKIAKV